MYGLYIELNLVKQQIKVLTQHITIQTTDNKGKYDAH